LAGDFAEIVRAVAVAQDVTYLPLYERMTGVRQRSGKRPGTTFRPGTRLAVTAVMRHFLLRRRFDAISHSRDLRLTTDTIHLSSRGAALIEEDVRQRDPPPDTVGGD
jgi:hypothetical protein